MAANELLTPSEAAAALGVSTAHLRYMAAQNKIRARHTPLGRVFTRAEVERVRDLRAAAPPRGRPSRGQRVA